MGLSNCKEKCNYSKNGITVTFEPNVNDSRFLNQPSGKNELNKINKVYLFAHNKSMPSGRTRVEVLNMGNLDTTKNKNMKFKTVNHYTKSINSLRNSSKNLDADAKLYENIMPLNCSGFVIQSSGKFEDKYEKKESLGKGGFGEVFKIQNKINKEMYAIKVIRISKIAKGKNWLPDIEILKQLDHPYIIRVYEYFKDIDNVYIISE